MTYLPENRHRRHRILGGIALVVAIGVAPVATLTAVGAVVARHAAAYRPRANSTLGKPLTQATGAVTYEEKLPGGTLYFGTARAGQEPIGLPASASTTEPTRAASSTTELTVQPVNSTGWSETVYIHLYSVGTSGPSLRRWWTSTTVKKGYHCAGPTYWDGRGNTVYKQPGQVCQGTTATGEYWYAYLTFGSGRTFNGQTLCNTWTNPPFPGKPCETVS